MHTEIEATYRVVTPMFCGGAEPDKRAELRPSSFKGVLRFWWRALAWSRLGGDFGQIKQQEDALFGSADGGQSSVSMRFVPGPKRESVAAREVLTVSQSGGGPIGEGARYLGYGVMEAFGSRKKGTKAGELTRACLRSPFEFTVRMLVRDGERNERNHSNQSAALEDALVCLGTHGGMGAKSRKGYGSLVIRSLLVDGEQRWRPPQTISEFGDSLTDLRRNHDAAEQPEYTALFAQTRQVLVPSDKNESMELLDLVGRELMRYRSWGRGGRLFGKESEKNFRDDHDLMVPRAGKRRDEHPRRIAFGLPHNYGSGPHRAVRPKEYDRRASPLFIHIHECGDTPVAVLSFLPARFLPEGRSDISVGGSPVRQTPEPELFQPIHEFLDRLLGLEPGKPKEPFGEVMEVKP